MTSRRLLLAAVALALVAAACKPIPYDFTGDHQGDLWWVDDAGWHDAVTGTTVARLADPATEHGQPAAGDYDGDGTWEPAEVIADATTWEPTGEWRTAGPAGSLWLAPPSCARPPDYPTGPSPLTPVVGDWDGDRTTDPGWFCAVTATWVLEGRAPFVFGRPWDPARHDRDVDIPAPADHDGDKRTDPVLYRPADGTWWAEGHGEPLLRTDGWGTPLAADLTTAPGDELVLWSATTGIWDVEGTPFSPSGSFPDPARVLPMPLDTDGDHRAERVELGEVGGVWTFVGQDGAVLATGPISAAYPSAAALPAAAAKHIVLTTSIEQACTGTLPPAGCPRPVPFDLDGEAGADLSWIETRQTDQRDAQNRRIYEHRWFVHGQPATPLRTWTSTNSMVEPAAGDHDGDGRYDLAVRTGAGVVTADDAGTPIGPPAPVSTTTCTGVALVAGQWDLDAATEVGWFRPDTAEWIIDGQPTVAFGRPLAPGGCEVDAYDVPVPADYDGDGTTERAVFQADTGHWLVEGHPGVFADLGTGAAYPAPADHDGDGVDEPAVLDEVWQTVGGSLRMVGTLRRDGSAPITFPPMDADSMVLPVPLDVDGDGDDDVAAIEVVPWIDLTPPSVTLHRIGAPSQVLGSAWITALPAGLDRSASQLARSQRCEASPPMVCDR